MSEGYKIFIWLMLGYCIGLTSTCVIETRSFKLSYAEETK